MRKMLFMGFSGGVLLFYAVASFLGWELANNGSNSRFGMPFIHGGYRGGK